MVMLLIMGVSIPELWGNSLRYKLKLSGYSDQQIENIIRGYKSLRQVQHENKSSMTAKKPTYASVSLSSRKSQHSLVTRYMQAYVDKYHGRQKKPGNISTCESIRQGIKERFLYNKRPPKYELIEQIRRSDNSKNSPSHDYADSTIVKKVKRYLNYVEDASYLNNVKKSLILAVIKVESGFNHRAVSPKGAQGLMQLMPFTAKSLGVTNPFDPMQNIHGGTRYLSECLTKLQDIKLALAAYNAGITRVSRMSKIPPFRETQNFVKNVLRYEKMYDQIIQNL